MTDAPIYLDHQASTPVDPRVAEAMRPWFEASCANPHSHSHLAGIEARNAVDQARRQIAQTINADAMGVIFTSGATEADNLAILGAAAAEARHRTARRITRNRIITLASEHEAVLGPVRALEEGGLETVVLPVQSTGRADMERLAGVIDDTTLLVSVMGVNNETGVMQPIGEIAALCRAHNVLLHSDCAQALGRIPVDVRAWDADLVTLSAHKAYGPKGIGALYLGPRARSRIAPITFGGGQERGLRPGTLPVPLCVGFGEACRIIMEELDGDMERVFALTARLVNAIKQALPTAILHGAPAHRAPGSISVAFPGAIGDALIDAFEGIQASAGSACTSASLEPSHVLTAYGLSRDLAAASLRFGIGRFTTEEEISRAAVIIGRGVRTLDIVRREIA